MERFRQMLNPTPVEAAQPSPDNQFFPRAQTGGGSIHHSTGLRAESGGGIVHALEQRHCQTNGIDAVAGRGDEFPASDGSGMETTATTVALAGAAAICDAAAEGILRRISARR